MASLGVRCWVVVVVAACGAPPAAPAKVIANTPPPAAPALATCKDAGIILRGPISSGSEEAGRAREQTIEKACRDDKWPQAMIDCVASTAHPDDCLAKLADPQRTAYGERLETWNDEYGGGEDAADGNYHMTLPVVDCANLMLDTSHYAPVLDDTAPERAWQLEARTGFLLEACDHDWPDSLKQCIETAGHESAELARCLAHELSADEQQALDKQLADVSALAAKLAAAKKKPASITCTKAVAAHYADAQWKQKLDGYKPDERKKMIATSRKLMTTTCTADKWDDTMRACIVLRGGDVCFDGRNKRKWGYPATGAVTAVGVAECDEYAAAVAKLTACNMLPQAARDSIVRSQQQMLAEIARVPAGERAKMGESCKAGMDAIAMSLSGAGC